MAKPNLNLSNNYTQLVSEFNSLSSNVGDLVGLNTTEDSDLVGAINEVFALVDTDLDFRSKISVTDAGGDGSLAYNSATGIITYTGPSASEVRAHLSAGEGIDFASGVISGEDATTSNKGIASFSTTNFTVSSGAVSIANDGVARANLKDEVSLQILNSSGAALKTLYGAGS
jgi:hypothetical protein